MAGIIDLDALMPPSVIFRLNGEEIEVKPPKISAALELAAAASQFANISAEATEKDPTLLDKVMATLKEKLDAIIPELQDKDLTMEQLLIVTGAISDMVTPPDAKELKAKGIRVDGDPKAPSA